MDFVQLSVLYHLDFNQKNFVILEKREREEREREKREREREAGEREKEREREAGERKRERGRRRKSVSKYFTQLNMYKNS